MSAMDALRVSDCAEWYTPRDLFDALDREFHFSVDVCSTHDNAKCPRHYTIEEDGLAQDWTRERVWMNPPYGRAITPWVRKAADSARDGALVVGLLPVRTDTRWWSDHVMRADEIRFLTGRVRFGGSSSGAPFGSAVAIWGCGHVPTVRQWDWRSGE